MYLTYSSTTDDFSTTELCKTSRGCMQPSANTVVDGVRQRVSIGASQRLQAFLCCVIREICAPELADSAELQQLA